MSISAQGSFGKQLDGFVDNETGSHRRKGNCYELTDQEIEQYRTKGFLVLKDFLNDEELGPIEEWFDHFTQGKQDGMERDFCDMSQPYGTPFEEFQLVNAVLPSTYRDELKNNIYQKIAQSVASQLHAESPVAMDYDQFLAKKPQKSKAEFAMHQDLGYWPKTEDTWTATFSLALSDSTRDAGCLVVVPGSNQEQELRSHRPVDYSGSGNLSENREQSHTLEIESKDSDENLYLPVKRGWVTIHDERIVHGSGGNVSDDWRKTYVMAFRTQKTIDEERAMGFTHSHNDEVNWETFIQ